MIGSEGTLGIITELTLKVIPAPKSVISLIIPYEKLRGLYCNSTTVLLCIIWHHRLWNLWKKEVVMDTEKFLGKQVYPKELEGTEIGAYLLATFDGNSEEQLEDIIEQASEVVLEAGAIDVLVADTPALKKDAWAVRGALLEAIEADTVLLDECDVVVPTNKIAEFLTYTKSLEAEADFRVKSFGHAGDGNLHIYTCSNDMRRRSLRNRLQSLWIKYMQKQQNSVE